VNLLQKSDNEPLNGIDLMMPVVPLVKSSSVEIFFVRKTGMPGNKGSPCVCLRTRKRSNQLNVALI